jgi:hypothetical protein
MELSEIEIKDFSWISENAKWLLSLKLESG